MLRRYRQRRGPYAMAAPSAVPSMIRTAIVLIVAALVLWLAGRLVLRLFGAGNEIQRAAASLTVENGGTVNVSLEGGLLQRAEDSLKLYPGDRITTGSSGNARLSLFDGSLVRTDVQSDLTLEESSRGTEQSEWGIDLPKGSLWIKTPTMTAFSGSILRTIATPRFTATLPSDAEVVVDGSSLMVFSADGDGVAFTSGDSDEVFIGEGQQIVLPEGEVEGDLRMLRTALDPLMVQKQFVEETRLIRIVSGSGASVGLHESDEALLTVASPEDHTTITESTVTVTGTVSANVERVRVNGYSIVLEERAFSQELSIKEGETLVLLIEALDTRGAVIAQVTRTVQRGDSTVTPPTITTPAGNGSTYRTRSTELEIRGTAAPGTSGIAVNDYTLQLFRPGDTTWSYLASTSLQNLREGENVFDVFALNASGKRSDPVRITVILDPAGTEGVVSAGNSTSSVSVESLPKNDPLTPGILSVTGPQPGSEHRTSEKEILIEGTTSSATHSLWINDYRLQLYLPGKTYWNYIAKIEYQNLRPGANTYVVVARNEKGEILDRFTYTVTYTP